MLMAEDLASVREHLTGLLAELAGVELRFVAQDAALATLIAATWRPDAVILDIRLRGAEALRAVQALKKEWPGMAVVLCASVIDPCQRDAHLGQGADFFFDKTLEWSELIAFLRLVCAAQGGVEAAGCTAGTAPAC